MPLQTPPWSLVLPEAASFCSQRLPGSRTAVQLGLHSRAPGGGAPRCEALLSFPQFLCFLSRLRLIYSVVA